jgi:hypothetical protein
LGQLRTEFFDESPLQGDERDKERKARTANRASSAKKRLYETEAEAAAHLEKVAAVRLVNKEQHQKRRAANKADPKVAAVRLVDKEQHQKRRAANKADPEKAAENAATRKKDNEQHKDKRNKERAAGEVRQTKVTLRRANMTEAERRAKKQLESGSRFDQDRATRLRDERLRVSPAPS